MSEELQHIKVNRYNKLLWIIAYCLIAISFIFIGQGNTFDQLLKIPSFYSDLIFAITVTYIVGNYLRRLNNYLNSVCPWVGFKRRLPKQIFYGIVLPSGVAMILEIIYLQAIDIPFRDSSIINLELPLSLLFLTLINLLYFINYLLSIKNTKTLLIAEDSEPVFKSKLEFITIQSGAREEQIPIDTCAFIFSSNKLLWLQTFSGRQYRIQGTLEQWEEKLNDLNFYRINRQFLCTPKAIQSVEQTETRKLKVNFIIQSANEVYVSKPNTARFRQWWKNESPT